MRPRSTLLAAIVGLAFAIPAGLLLAPPTGQAGGQTVTAQDLAHGPVSPVLYRGTETLVVSYPADKGKPKIAAGWELPENFVVHNVDLSRDGKRAWLLLFNSRLKDNRWQLWSMNVDGSDAKQSAFASDNLPGTPYVLTNRDGSVAWVFANPAGGMSQVFHVTPGAAARLVLDNKDNKDLKDYGSLGWPQVTLDGKSLFFLARGQGVVQLRDDGSHKIVLAKKDVSHQGKTLADEWMWHLAINGDGSQFAFASRFGGLKDRPSVVVRQSAQGLKLHLDTTPTAAGTVFDGLTMSEDGDTVLMERSSSAKDGRLQLWRGDKLKTLKADVPDTAYGFLAGNGKTLYAATGDFGFWEDVESGKRHRLMTKAVAGWHNSFGRDHRLSSDGSVLAMVYSGERAHGLYIFQARPAPADYPQINSVRQRYQGSKLLVTVEVDPKSNVGRVFAQGLKDGYINPHQVLKKEDNPLYDPLWFPDANLAAVEGHPGVYQFTIDVGSKRGLLNDSFSIRLGAVNPQLNKATFVDVPVLRDDGLAKIDFHDFDTFRKKLDAAKYEDYKGKPGVKVASEAEFKKMKSHIQELYQGVTVTHTFTLGSQHIDCVAVDKQPGALAEVKRGRKLQLTPPAVPGMPKAGDGKKQPTDFQHAEGHLKKGNKDPFDKETHCPEGSIPMRRVTLEDVVRFETLHDFFQRHPGGSQPPPTPKVKGAGRPMPVGFLAEGFAADTLLPDGLLAKAPAPEGPPGHRYAHAYQFVDNFGGSSFLSVWNPIPTDGQFSLSQHWYTGGDPIQTVEGGWQVYPAMYQWARVTLFIYWTADNYQNTGAYNLTRPGFIQVNNAYVLGLYWDGFSLPDAPQVGFWLKWYRDPATGNWWLGIKGGGPEVAMGYYPQSLFGNGQMSKFATQVDYGGEVTGAPATGQMGSGLFANSGWGKAAWQSHIHYYPTKGGSAWTELTPHLTNPDYYTIDVQNFSQTNSNWGTYFYYGGPGGR